VRALQFRCLCGGTLACFWLEYTGREPSIFHWSEWMVVISRVGNHRMLVGHPRTGNRAYARWSEYDGRCLTGRELVIAASWNPYAAGRNRMVVISRVGNHHMLVGRPRARNRAYACWSEYDGRCLTGRKLVGIGRSPPHGRHMPLVVISRREPFIRIPCDSGQAGLTIHYWLMLTPITNGAGGQQPPLPRRKSIRPLVVNNILMWLSLALRIIKIRVKPNV